MDVNWLTKTNRRPLPESMATYLLYRAVKEGRAKAVEVELPRR